MPTPALPKLVTRSRTLAAGSGWFTLLLGVLAALPVLSIDLSAPTLVALPAALGTGTTVAGLTLSLFMLGFAAGLLAGGRLSDRRGRRPVLLGGLLVYALAGLLCTVARSGPELAGARLVQGVGAGACAVQALAMVQDLFQGEAARDKRAYVTTLVGAVPVLAPALGAWLNVAAGWRSVHAVLAAAGALLLALVWWRLGESRPAAARSGRRPLPGERLRDDPCFPVLALINALSYGALFAYIAGAPVVIMGQLGHGSATYAAVFAGTALALCAGAWVSPLLGRLGITAGGLAWRGLAGQAAATVALALYCTETTVGTGLVALPLLALACLARGVAAPNLVHLAIAPRNRDAGLATAVLGVAQLLAAAGASAVVAVLLPAYRATAVAAPMALMAGGAAAIWLATTRRRGVMAPETAE